MELKLYQVDAFSDQVFSGNPAAVVPLNNQLDLSGAIVSYLSIGNKWLSDSQMLAIAQENNLAETAFFIRKGSDFEIRWFTPMTEVDLCGHATLASAFVLFNLLGYQRDTLTFHSRSGVLNVTRDCLPVQSLNDACNSDELIILNFPSQKPHYYEVPNGLSDALNIEIDECLNENVCLVVLKNEQEVVDLTPDFKKLIELNLRGVIVTAPSEKYDFVNRYFAPNVGVDEDSVTGSAFTKLIPYWAERLNKTSLFAKQVSFRSGEVYCELLGDRVLIGGKATKYLEGVINI